MFKLPLNIMPASKFVVHDLTWSCPKPTKVDPSGNAGRNGCSIKRLSDEILLEIFAYCDSFSVTRFIMVNRHWNKLGTALLERNWTSVSDRDLKDAHLNTNDKANRLIRRIAPVLRSLDISSEVSVTLSGPFPPFSRLEELVLGGYGFRTYETVFQIISTSHSTLRSLTFEYISDLTEGFAIRLAPYLKNLHKLFLRYRLIQNNSAAGSAILLGAPNEPRSLLLPRGCEGIDLLTILTVISTRLETLEYLGLHCTSFDSEGLLVLFEDGNAQTGTPTMSPLKLHGLNLSQCEYLDDASIFDELRGRLTNLTYLNISFLDTFSSDPFQLAQFLQSTPKIETISAQGTQGFTDEVLLSLLHSCTSLKYLHFEENTELTALGISRFIRSAPDSLLCITFLNMNSITDLVVLELLNLSRKRSWEAFTKDPKNFVSRCNLKFGVGGCDNVTDAIFVLYVLQLFEYYLVRPDEVVLGSQPLSSLRWTGEVFGFLSTDIQDADQLTSVVQPCYPFMTSEFYDCIEEEQEQRLMRKKLLILMKRTLLGIAWWMEGSEEQFPHSMRLQILFRQYLQELTTIKDARFAICGFRMAADEAFGREDVEAALNRFGVKLSAHEVKQEDGDFGEESDDQLEIASDDSIYGANEDLSEDEF
ncbi:hypothetical protein BZA70DRAFT_274331 [Myxozyma melibiosi]|uniref:F-box domain-containing protein n=1 Tax=Myxozyma melibiosi TaxID=54550 RepID=A0ABR1FBH9_9ASCO